MPRLSAMECKFLDSKRNGNAVHVYQEPRGRPATPHWYFFYGTLTDPKLLAQVAELDEEPTMTKAKAARSNLKYFGHYPVLCLGEDVVDGVAWFVPTSDIVERIREYESDAYREYPKNVKLENGEEILATTFIWNGDEEDLEDEDWVTRQRGSSSAKAPASKRSNDPDCQHVGGGLKNSKELMAWLFDWSEDEEDLEDEDWATRQRGSSSEKAPASKRSNDPDCQHVEEHRSAETRGTDPHA